MSQKIRIGDKLVQYGYITEEQLQKALSLQRGTGKRIGEILIEQGLITAELLTNVLTELLNVDSIDLTPSNIKPEAIHKVPQNICKRYKVFPYKIEDNRLYLAMEDPQNMEAIQDVRRITGMDVVSNIATTSEINQAIDLWYSGTDIDKAISEYARNEINSTIKDEITGEEDVNSAPIVRLVHGILESAVRKKASDIHIEYDGDLMRVRFRVDGILMEHMKTSAKAYKAIISRIKIMANLNISEKRLPQDGRIYLIVDNKPVDFRVSTMPTSKDEKVVMRVLDKSSFMVSKEKLGFTQESIKMYDSFLAKPYGLILVVGPTGSGKTTTLYSMLNQLNDVEKNILTIEDPVEYELQGVNQSQINYKAGLDFASALRSFLRQDPDIIMVGEIRDHDTAEIAIRASLTGHLVLSTLHANTAVGAISRLSDMNIDSFLITSSLVGVVAQRLVRKICPFCKYEYEASVGDKKALGYDLDKDLKLYRGEGCDKCNNTGYKGRLGIYEMIQITKSIRDLIDQGAKEDVILAKANELGMKTMRQDAAIKVMEGQTTVEEMIRATFISD
ncbi:GspE/PulE family protein [Romboutsia sp.]|uniref:GspE/PulE family protein n=1 Tax=Romboutsia sp. TaxID=1965302 RepID=UPI003F37C7A1